MFKDDSRLCQKFTKKHILSPQKFCQEKDKFIELCDCIINCQSYYLIIELKDGRVNEKIIKKVIRQIKNCFSCIKKLINTDEIKRLLIYEKFDLPPSKQNILKKQLDKEQILYISIKRLNKLKKEKKFDICHQFNKK